MLLSVPGASSSLGLPGTVTRPDLPVCLYCRWLPLVLINCQPSCSTNLMTSRTFTPQVYLHSIRCSAWSGECYRRNPTEVHSATGSKRYALSKQLLSLLVGSLGQICKLAVNSDNTVRQPLMAVVSGTSQQRAHWLVPVGYTVPPERYLSVSRHASGRNTTLKHIHELPPVHESLPLPDAALRRIALQASLDRVEEAKGHAAVEDAVVEGDLQVHHTADGYGVVHDDWSLDDGLGLEDGRLRVVYDRRGGDAPQGAGVVDREGAPRYVLGAELLGTRALHNVVYPAGEADDVQLVGAADYGYDQGSLLQVHRDPDVDLLPKHDPVPVPHRVENRVLLEAIHGSLDDERQVGETHTLALGERRLPLLAQSSETRHVHLDQRPGMRYLRLAQSHAVRDGAPDTCELHDPVAIVYRNALRFSLGLLRRGWCGLAFRCAFFDVALDVLLGHPAAGASAGDLRDVHAVLLGEPPHDRRGPLQTQRVGILHRPVPVTFPSRAPGLGDRALLLAAISGSRLCLGVRGREPLGGGFGGHSFARLGFCGRRFFFPGDGD